MLGVSRGIGQRLLAPAASSQIVSVRHKTVPIITITPVFQPTNRTMGPYPRTPEERLRAAKKYNLIPEDYQPFPEDEGFGDYPDLPAIGAFNRYKYDDFEDIIEMRHFGEPFHINADWYTWERSDPMFFEKVAYKHTPFWKKFANLFGLVGGVWFLLYAQRNSRVNFNFPYKIREYGDGSPLYAFPETESAHHGGHH